MPTDPDASALKKSFQVTGWVHVLGGWVSRNPGFWTWLGNLETDVLTEAAGALAVREPIYVTGLARAGSTLLLEILHRHPDTAAHRYRDYPMVFTPYWWNRYLDLARTPPTKAPARERTHGDGIFVTPESPEAFEEVLWMAFFKALHDPETTSVLDETTHHPAFEAFYRDHIRKLLLVRGGRRYLAKGNYNITRLGYLLKLFPDARLVIPVREPARHIASLMRQHRRFCEGQRLNPRALAHLERVGHFEFGLGRRPIHTGDTARVAEVIDLWADGAEVEGWARYWALIHDFLADTLAENPRCAQAVRLLPHESLCRAPEATLKALFDHCRLEADDGFLTEAAAMIKPPPEGPPKMFSAAELALIERHTARTAHRLGLGSPG